MSSTYSVHVFPTYRRAAKSIDTTKHPSLDGAVLHAIEQLQVDGGGMKAVVKTVHGLGPAHVTLIRKGSKIIADVSKSGLAVMNSLNKANRLPDGITY